MRREPRHILIVATRRSGSTPFWRVFRQVPAYTALDEPFNPVLRKLPRENPAGTRRELIELFRTDPEGFGSRFSPIGPQQETAPGMTAEQRGYLDGLLSHGPVVTDTTRCLGKIADLHTVAPEAVLVHLYRRPSAFVTSHLLPSGRRGPIRMREAIRRRSFFVRTSGFNKWGMEDLLAGAHRHNTRRLLRAVRVVIPEAGSRAVDLLLRYWLGSFRLFEREGRRRYGRRFVSVEFERFCARPRAHVRRILRCAGFEASPVDCSAIRRPGRAYRSEDRRWTTLAAEAGFSAREVEAFFP